MKNLKAKVQSDLKTFSTTVRQAMSGHVFNGSVVQ